MQGEKISLHEKQNMKYRTERNEELHELEEKNQRKRTGEVQEE
jgi:hypothetical protein